MRKNIYLPKNVNDLLIRYANNHRMFHSQVIRFALLEYFKKEEITDDKRLKRLELREKLALKNEMFKFELSIGFQKFNIQRKLICLIARSDKKQILKVIREAEQIAKLSKNIELKKWLKEIKGKLLKPKEHEAIKSECLPYAQAMEDQYNENMKKVRR